MNREVYRYRFKEKISLKEIEDSLFLSVLATESVFGRSRIRLDASFYLDKKKRACVIDASTEVGRHIASVFTGFLMQEFGEDAFRVERSDNPEKKTASV